MVFLFIPSCPRSERYEMPYICAIEKVRSLYNWHALLNIKYPSGDIVHVVHKQVGPVAVIQVLRFYDMTYLKIISI